MILPDPTRGHIRVRGGPSWGEMHMKTSTLRNAVSIALLGTIASMAAPVWAQETTASNRDSSSTQIKTESDSKTATNASDTSAITTLESVQVTGTRIRGGTTASPVITIGSEQIQQEGFTDLGQVIRSIPQNFSGGQNPGVLSGNLQGAGVANQNMTGGSSLNLRGLGPDATLTLLNG